MSGRFGTVAIVGVGLLGGSLGLALKQRGLATAVRGIGHRATTLEAALAAGTVDTVHLDALEGVEGANVIVLCTPAARVMTLMDTLGPVVPRDVVVTDVASTKAAICAHAEATWPKPLRFVGSHPMAGSEKFGPEHADPALYEGRYTILTPTPHADADAVAVVRALWESVGSRVVPLDPAHHDSQVARTSHIPHIVAACLAELAAANEAVPAVVGTGFRDMTRVAEGRAEIWSEICLTNREAIRDGLDELGTALERVRRLIDESHHAELEAFFESAQQARREALGP